MMAQQGKRVLLIGCDPKSDTTSLLFSGRSCPTIIETSSKEEAGRREGRDRRRLLQARRRVRHGARRPGGRAAAAAGAASFMASSCWRSSASTTGDFDYVLLDFLGDVVCGGFGLPIARDMCQKVIVVGSNDLQSLYVANNVCSAVEYFRKLGGNVGVAGMVINKDDGTGEAQAFAKSRSASRCSRRSRPTTTSAARAPATRSSASPAARWGRCSKSWRGLGRGRRRRSVAHAAVDQDEALLGLFKSDSVGRDVVLEPATIEDMCGRSKLIEKPSLEVIYDGRIRAGHDDCHSTRNPAPEGRHPLPPGETGSPNGCHGQGATSCADAAEVRGQERGA